MSKPTYDPNSPLIQASITSDGGTDWPVVDELGDPGMRSTTQRPGYPESEATIRSADDNGPFGTNDSTISDDAMGPVNIPLSQPDYAPPEVNEPDDGWGPENDRARTELPPGSFRGAVHMSDPQCKPGPQSLLGAPEDFR